MKKDPLSISLNELKTHFTNRKFLLYFVLSLGLLLVSLVVNFYAGAYSKEMASSFVTDIILSNTRAMDVDLIFLYGPLVLVALIAYVAFANPKRMLFVIQSISLFVLIRSLFVSLTHLGPFPDAISMDSNVLKDFTVGTDLFFSGHTGLPFLMALVFWENKYLRVLFIITSVLFGIVVLAGHLHYSIDVLSAFFITYGIYKISERFLPKNYELV
ncbi:MAG: phosphatase PAP2-related protein [Minisyncoccia bacterium]